MTQEGDKLLPILLALADCEISDNVSWMRDDAGTGVNCLVNCNDVFYWGTADAEYLTAGNADVLRSSYKDFDALTYEESIGGSVEMLFCARVRQLRPQHPVLQAMADKCRELFEACGPEREAGFFNPNFKTGETGCKKVCE